MQITSIYFRRQFHFISA